MKVYCICIVGKKNNPLYIKTTHWSAEKREEDTLKFHFLSHSCLDILEEKMSQKKVSQNMFIGLLYPTELYKIYGFVTSTKTKYVLITDENDGKENDAKVFLNTLHEFFVREQMNPFYDIDTKIESQRFEKNVDELIFRFSVIKSKK